MEYGDLIFSAKCCDLKVCDECPSKSITCCQKRAMIELANALEKEIEHAESAELRAEQAEKERDAAVRDINILAESFYFEANGKNPCIICDNVVRGNQKGGCKFCNETLGFRWRGVQFVSVFETVEYWRERAEKEEKELDDAIKQLRKFDCETCTNARCVVRNGTGNCEWE